jgi:hypothetical protein
MCVFSTRVTCGLCGSLHNDARMGIECGDVGGVEVDEAPDHTFGKRGG